MGFESFPQFPAVESKPEKIEVIDKDREFLESLDSLKLEQRVAYDKLLRGLDNGYLIRLGEDNKDALPESILQHPSVRKKIEESFKKKLLEQDNNRLIIHEMALKGIGPEFFQQPGAQAIKQKAWQQLLEEGQKIDFQHFKRKPSDFENDIINKEEQALLDASYGSLSEAGFDITEPAVRQSAIKGIVHRSLHYYSDFENVDEYINGFLISNEELKEPLINGLKSQLDELMVLDALKTKFPFVAEYLSSPASKEDAKKLIYSRLSDDKNVNFLSEFKEYFNLQVAELNPDALKAAASENLKLEGYHFSGKFKESYKDLSPFLDDEQLGEVYVKAIRLNPKAWIQKLADAFSLHNSDEAFEIFDRLKLPQDIFRKAGMSIIAEGIRTQRKLDDGLKEKAIERFHFSDDDIAEAITIGRIDLAARESRPIDLEHEAIVRSEYTSEYAKDTYIDLLQKGELQSIEALEALFPIEWKKGDQRILEREWAVREALKKNNIAYHSYSPDLKIVKKFIDDYFPSADKRFLFSDPEVKEQIEREAIGIIEKYSKRFSKDTADFISYANLSTEDIAAKLDQQLGFINSEKEECIKLSLSKYDERGQRIPWLSDPLPIDVKKHNDEWFEKIGETKVRSLLQSRDWSELRNLYQNDTGKALIDQNITRYGKDIIASILTDSEHYHDLEEIAVFPQAWADLRSFLVKQKDEQIDEMIQNGENQNIRRALAASTETTHFIDRNLGESALSIIKSLARYPECESYVHAYIQEHLPEIKNAFTNRERHAFQFLLSYPEGQQIALESILENSKRLPDFLTLPHSSEIEELLSSYTEASPEIWNEVLLSQIQQDNLEAILLYPKLKNKLELYIKENAEQVARGLLMLSSIDKVKIFRGKIPELDRAIKEHLAEHNITHIYEQFSSESAENREYDSLAEYISKAKSSLLRFGGGEEYMRYLLFTDPSKLVDYFRDNAGVYSLSNSLGNLSYGDLPVNVRSFLLDDCIKQLSKSYADGCLFYGAITQSVEMKNFLNSDTFLKLPALQIDNICSNGNISYDELSEKTKDSLFKSAVERIKLNRKFSFYDETIHSSRMQELIANGEFYDFPPSYIGKIAHNLQLDYNSFPENTKQKMLEYAIAEANSGKIGMYDVPFWEHIIFSPEFKDYVASGELYNQQVSMSDYLDFIRLQIVSFEALPARLKSEVFDAYIYRIRSKEIVGKPNDYQAIVDSKEFRAFAEKADVSARQMEALKNASEGKTVFPESIERKLDLLNEKAGIKAQCLRGLIIFSSYLDDEQARWKKMGETLDSVMATLDLYKKENLPAQAHVSMGMEYEVTKSVGMEYLHSWNSYSNDIEDISSYCNIGRGNDGLHEIATKPTENPYALLAEMKLLQDSGFIDFNKKTYKKAGSGYHFTVSGETGIDPASDMHFLQNTLVVSGWGGLNAGKSSGSPAIRYRGISDDLVPLFEEQSRGTGTEIRGNSIDSWEPFEKSVITMFNASIATQVRYKYHDEYYLGNDTNFIDVKEFPENPAKLRVLLEKGAQFKGITDNELSILYEWEKLKFDMVQAIRDHNRGFVDSEFRGGFINGADKYIDTEEHIDIRRNKNLLKEQHLSEAATEMKSHIPEALFINSGEKFMNALTFTNNIFLKPPAAHEENAVNSTAINAAAVLANVKAEGYKHVDRKYGYTDSVFERGYVDFDTYYCYQGASEEMITHKSQILLNRFNKRMQEILKQPTPVEVVEHEYA